MLLLLPDAFLFFSLPVEGANTGPIIKGYGVLITNKALRSAAVVVP
jgi:hypothetical protein